MPTRPLLLVPTRPNVRAPGRRSGTRRGMRRRELWTPRIPEPLLPLGERQPKSGDCGGSTVPAKHLIAWRCLEKMSREGSAMSACCGCGADAGAAPKAVMAAGPDTPAIACGTDIGLLAGAVYGQGTYCGPHATGPPWNGPPGMPAPASGGSGADGIARPSVPGAAPTGIGAPEIKWPPHGKVPQSPGALLAKNAPDIGMEAPSAGPGNIATPAGTVQPLKTKTNGASGCSGTPACGKNIGGPAATATDASACAIPEAGKQPPASIALTMRRCGSR